MIKRLFDFTASLLGLIILFPLMLLIGLWIKFDSSGPVFFRQIRVGQGGHNFLIYKFRTMRADADKQGGNLTVANDSRITASGHFLRKYKLDELPQLLNVLIGNMSLVGPRPEVPEYIRYYSAQSQAKILSVKPGITDLASIEFRNENAMLEASEDYDKTYRNEIMPIKEKYYTAYVAERSFFLDLKIIFLTIKAIVF